MNAVSTPDQSSTTPPRTPSREGWQLKDIVLLVVLGVVFGVLYWALVQAWGASRLLFGDLAEHVLAGGWLIVAPIAIAIIRRPFAGIGAELIAAVVEFIFLGSPVGPLLAVVGLIQGAGSELPFALTRYRNYSWWIFAVSGLLGAGLVFFWSAYQGGWYGTDLLWIRFVVQIISGVILGGLLAKVTVGGIHRTGVVDNYAIGRESE